MWWSHHKNPRVWGLESSQAGKQVEVLGNWCPIEGREVPAPSPHNVPMSLPHRCSAESFAISFYNKLVSESETVSQSCPTLCDLRLLCPWNSPHKNTGVGCHFLLQGIFLTQGLNLSLLQCRQILYSLSHKEAPWQ